jgi:membrane protein CcdC involved in cytochrome C biogenesis
MDGLLRVLSIFSLPISAVMFFLLVKKIGREQPSRRRAHLLGIIMPCLMMGVNIVFMLSVFIAWCPAIWLPILLAGFGFGYFWGKTSKLYKRGETLMVKRTGLHLGFWALSYTLTQLMSTIMPASIAAAGLATMFFSTGSSIGVNTNLMLRQRRFEAEALLPQKRIEALSAGITCPKCKTLNRVSYLFCKHCGQQLRDQSAT